MAGPAFLPADTVYATAVSAPSGYFASFFWARRRRVGKPLVLCDWELEFLDDQTWPALAQTIDHFRRDQQARYGDSGVFVEDPAFAALALDAGITPQMIPDHLCGADYWPRLCASANLFIAQNMVGYTTTASYKMDKRPFLDRWAGQPRTSLGEKQIDGAPALIPAFLFGIVLGLDETAATPPRPNRVPMTSRVS